MTFLLLPLALDFCLFFIDVIDSLLSLIFFRGGSPLLFDPDSDERVDCVVVVVDAFDLLPN